MSRSRNTYRNRIGSEIVHASEVVVTEGGKVLGFHDCGGMKSKRWAKRQAARKRRRYLRVDFTGLIS